MFAVVVVETKPSTDDIGRDIGDGPSDGEGMGAHAKQRVGGRNVELCTGHTRGLMDLGSEREGDVDGTDELAIRAGGGHCGDRRREDIGEAETQLVLGVAEITSGSLVQGETRAPRRSQTNGYANTAPTPVRTASSANGNQRMGAPLSSRDDADRRADR